MADPAPPTTPWTGRVAAETAEAAPTLSALIQSFIDDMQHMHQTLVKDTDVGYTGTIPHFHLGDEDLPVDPAEGINFVLNCMPVDPHSVNANRWRRQGFYDVNSDGRWQGQAAGDFLYHMIFVTPSSRRITLGGGDDWVTSLYAKTLAAPTTGQLSFGVASGKSGGMSGNPTSTQETSFQDFDPGGRCVIDHTDLSTTWKRFYGVITKGLNRPPNQPNWAIRIDDEFDEAVQVVAFSLTSGRTLHWFDVCPVEKADGNQTYNNWHYANTPADVPIWELATSITNAVEVEPV